MQPDAQHILKRYWGYPAFRPQQEEIILSLLGGRDTLALLPTGGGKSLCYQVPGMMREGLTLVVSPLISLMQDQVADLKKRGILAAALYSGMRYFEVKQTLDNVLHGPFKFLYVSPERLQTDLFRDYLPDLPLACIAVDEAHCISQWGHDFRPEYRNISDIRSLFPGVPMLALTATATPAVEDDIIRQLLLHSPAVFKQSFERKNILFRVRYSEDKTTDVLKALEEQEGSSIVYCRSRRHTELLAAELRRRGIAATLYHAGLPREEREKAGAAWLGNEQRVMVATTAFGMGINKPDVRQVIHYDVPEQPEAFYQEAGRGGRDGLTARSLILYRSGDLQKLEDNIALQYPPLEYLRQVYQAVAEYLQVPIGTAPDRDFSFEIRDFCAKFRLDVFAATYALRLLAREGLWTLSDSVFSPAAVQVTADREAIEVLQQRYPEPAYLLTTLLRMYQGVFYYPVSIRLAAIARQVRSDQDTVHRLLLQLQGMGFLEYHQPKDGPRLFFRHERVDSRHLLVDVQRIRRLREEQQHRVAVMRAYLEEQEGCRTRLLLSYFGEEAPRACGHCDNCLRRRSAAAGKGLRETLLQLLQDRGPMKAPELLSHFGPEQRVQAGSLLRNLLDDRALLLSPEGLLSLRR